MLYTGLLKETYRRNYKQFKTKKGNCSLIALKEQLYVVNFLFFD